uniref:Uncharacterized protein n=1 Tax=Chromera velia CCMP2878 TaxID=1169474 RepID=A0A0G4FSX7_9ALVE|eukprot:Cvel_3675.t1-p1 / transcript=Cvel_3675.t1 / gene=Cvel_3675 / organism=Chromera_velia_CCMP2878 / gene_product=hypothetical protein / transcript_product=hypothetical protein / location=Cvel_scaffold152:114111-116306(-) / protein_length=250 / sequence_SO=supercontig / SO=protein_coding / is_pseudo=false
MHEIEFHLQNFPDEYSSLPPGHHVRSPAAQVKDTDFSLLSVVKRNTHEFSRDYLDRGWHDIIRLNIATRERGFLGPESQLARRMRVDVLSEDLGPVERPAKRSKTEAQEEKLPQKTEPKEEKRPQDFSLQEMAEGFRTRVILLRGGEGEEKEKENQAEGQWGLPTAAWGGLLRALKWVSSAPGGGSDHLDLSSLLTEGRAVLGSLRDAYKSVGDFQDHQKALKKRVATVNGQMAAALAAAAVAPVSEEEV